MYTYVRGCTEQEDTFAMQHVTILVQPSHPSEWTRLKNILGINRSQFGASMHRIITTTNGLVVTC